MTGHGSPRRRVEGDHQRGLTSAGGSSPDGGITFRLRIGVTGHRNIAPDDDLRAGIAAAIDAVRNRIPASDNTKLALRAVSPLAEGADRIVAGDIAARPGGDLEVSLPFPSDQYRGEFATAASRSDFDDLLERATVTQVVSVPIDPERGYELVGRWVADHSDVLLAVWDGAPAGGPGGTADVVEYARKRQLQGRSYPVPLVIVDPNTGTMVSDGIAGPAWDSCLEAYNDLSDFNTRAISAAAFAKACQHARSNVVGDGNLEATALKQSGDGTSAADAGAATIDELADWIAPYYGRADQLARRDQRRHNALIDAILLLAAAAVAAGAAASILWPEVAILKWLEVSLMVGLLLSYCVARWQKPHPRWLACRALAERLRVAPFLAVTDASDTLDDLGAARPVIGTTPAALVSWHWRAFLEVWDARPVIEVGIDDLPWIKRFLIERWIDPQIAYHERSTRQHQRNAEALRKATLVLFTLTLVATLIHVFTGFERVPAALSIVLPAFGGALTGVANHREYSRQSRRYDWMATMLKGDIRNAIERADSLEAIAVAARRAARLTVSENDEWVEMMSVHGAEIG